MRRVLILVPAIALMFAIGSPGTASAGLWERCGIIQTQSIAFYNTKAKHTSCKSAAKVARKWNRRVLKNKCEYTSCTAFGYQCTATNIQQTEYYTSYKVKCQRGPRHVVWTISLD